jgi:hypothetical protein
MQEIETADMRKRNRTTNNDTQLRRQEQEWDGWIAYHAVASGAHLTIHFETASQPKERRRPYHDKSFKSSCHCKQQNHESQQPLKSPDAGSDEGGYVRGSVIGLEQAW